MTCAAAALTLAVSVLAGCTGGDPAPPQTSAVVPSTTTTSTPSTTTSTSPASSTTSAGPTADRADASPNGAAKFAAYFLERVNVLFSKPDSNALDSLYLASCKTCSAFEDAAAESRRNSRHSEGDTLTVTGNEVLKHTASSAQILVRFTQNPVRILNSDGSLYKTAKKTDGAFVVEMTRANSLWSVSSVKAAR